MKTAVHYVRMPGVNIPSSNRAGGGAVKALPRTMHAGGPVKAGELAPRPVLGQGGKYASIQAARNAK